MGKHEGKDELENVESIPREQAEKEMREAAKNVREQGSRGSSRSNQGGEEEEKVTPETRKQAREEMREAVERVKEEEE
jgi:hypothetical protein